MKLSSNRDLYDYLLSLRSTLEARGFVELSQGVASASHQAADISTVFLGEARIALRKLANDKSGALTKQEQADLVDVLEQLDAAFKNR